MKNKIFILPFKVNFVKYIAELIIKETEGRDFSGCIVVFPGKRPELYLKKFLSKLLSSPCIPPQIFSMENFIFHLFSILHPDVVIGSELDLAWLLYTNFINKKLQLGIKSDIEFSKFLPFGLSIINAIDELNQELVPDSELRNLRYKGKGEDSAEEVDSFLTIKSILEAEFLSRKRASRGFIYRSVAEKIEDIIQGFSKKIFFCGHFALTESEARIIKHFLERGSASLYTQIEERENEVFKTISRKLNAELELIPSGERSEPEITYYTAPNLHLEVLQAGECLIKSLPSDDTVIVLPDDSRLLPLLNTVMSRITEDYNVTMGLPFTRTPQYNLIKSIIHAMEYRTQDGFYARDYLNVILHPYVKNFGVNGNNIASQIIVRKIEELVIKKRMTFIKLKDIEEGVFPGRNDIYTETMKAIREIETEQSDIDDSSLKDFVTNLLHREFFLKFERPNSIKDFVNSMRNLMLLLVKNDKNIEYPLARNIFVHMFIFFENLEKLCFAGEQLEPVEIFHIVLKGMQRIRVPFEGYPLKGIQIMGLLETRNLQFDNVIILDVNEGILPGSQKYDPILNNNIRKELGIPTYRENEQIYRYYFKRLIGGSKKTHILYLENDEAIRSRFVEELIWEYQRQHKTFEEPTTEKITSIATLGSSPSPVVYKDESVIKKIITRANEKGFSPTAIDKYLNCPLSFYYQYVLGFEEKDRLSQEIEAKDIGSLVHEILQRFFTHFLGKRVELHEEHRKLLKDITEKTFIEFSPYGNRGELYLLKEVVKYRLDRFYEKLKRITKDENIEIIALEEKFFDEFELDASTKVMLTGYIDRVERRGEKFIIIDYKTGEADDIIPAVNKLQENISPSALGRIEAKKIVRSFQLPVYLYLFYKSKHKHYHIQKWEELNAVIYMIRNNQERSLFNFKIPPGTLMDDILIPTLKNIILEILSPDIPFTRDDSDPRRCIFCSFSSLCRRL